MSKYTTELQYIIAMEKINPPSETQLSLTKVLNSYPLENEGFIDPTRKDNKTRREVLNEKIIKHYFFSEIGQETVPRFLYVLDRKLNEIMPLYNQRYKSIDLEINPIDNVNMTETFTHSIEGNGSTTSSGSSTNNDVLDSLGVESDTPPTELTETDILSNKFASRTNHNKNTSTGSQNSNGHINSTDNKTETYTRKEFGSSKGYTFAQNIEQWRNIMINIDKEIVEELQDLFINLW